MQLLEDNGLPEPDDVEFGEDCVRFLWYDRKVALVIDLEADEFDGPIPDGIAC